MKRKRAILLILALMMLVKLRGMRHGGRQERSDFTGGAAGDNAARAFGYDAGICGRQHNVCAYRNGSVYPNEQAANGQGNQQA